MEVNMTEPEILDMGGVIAVCWPPIDVNNLEWSQTEQGTEGPRKFAIVQDADNKARLVEKDEDGSWREMLDGEMLGRVIPVRWAVPTPEQIEALAFG
jgi:hypothetical protein